MSKKLFFALENESTPVISGDTNELLDAQTSMDAASDDVVAETGDVAELQAGIDDGVIASDELNAVGERLEAKADAGEGISEDEAQMANIVVESVRNRLGITSSATAFPAIESFRSSASSVTATRVALEASIKETVRNIWERIKAFIGRVIEKIKSIVANILKNYDGVVKYLEALKKRALASQGKQKKDTLENSSLAKDLTVNGKADASTVIELLGNATKLGEIYGPLTTKVAAAAGTVAKALADGSTPSIDTKDLLSHFKSLNITTSGDTASTGPYVGNRSIDVVRLGGEDGQSYQVKTSSLDNPAKTLPALSSQEASKLADQLIAGARSAKAATDKIRSQERLLSDVQKAVDTVLNTLAKGAKTDDAPNAGKPLQAHAKTVNSLINLASAVAMNAPAFMFQTVKRGADYVAAAVGNLEGKAEPEAK